MRTKEAYDFKEKRRQYRRYNMEALLFALADIKAVFVAWPDHPNASWYSDDAHTINREILRRAPKNVCSECGKPI